MTVNIVEPRSSADVTTGLKPLLMYVHSEQVGNDAVNKIVDDIYDDIKENFIQI